MVLGVGLVIGGLGLGPNSQTSDQDASGGGGGGGGHMPCAHTTTLHNLTLLDKGPPL